jgi:hypothetical protein
MGEDHAAFTGVAGRTTSIGGDRKGCRRRAAFGAVGRY